MITMGSEHCGDNNSTDRVVGSGDYAYSSPTVPSILHPISSSSPGPSSCSPARFIEHPVSKMDTLAGVAIKYGVEVADIKRINGLVTDHQMFALKTLRIPLPGRHPPSTCLSNDTNNAGPSESGKTPTHRMHSDILESFESLKVTPDRKVSPAMSSLQGYYGLRPPAPPRRNSSEGFEMAVYSKENPVCLDDGPILKSSPGMNRPLSLQRKSRSLANCFPAEEDDLCNDNNNTPLIEHHNNDSSYSAKWFEKLARRHQRSEAYYTPQPPEKLLKEENGIGGWFSAIAGKGLALRSKAVNRNNLASEAEGVGGANVTSSSLSASVVSDGFSVIRKSSSTSSLQEQENGPVSSRWSGSKWNLKPDLQALSTTAIAKPILDGLSKPIGGRKTKAALD